ncbi:universal stress protein [Bradyrhizobium sp. WYCCWR 12677]|nr:universal stress protein [Bradyrhizobium sp. WYCCWR 12677]MDN5001210.1 universal stress protein [Bradyrhizobium sp. WYCCWR 12677]
MEPYHLLEIGILFRLVPGDRQQIEALSRGIGDCLDLVAIEVTDECPEIIRIVVRPYSWRAFVGSTLLESELMEAPDSVPVGRLEGDVYAVADRVLVGWKDTREARIAVRDALPFLSKASQVTIVEICTSDEQDVARRRVRDVAKYLQAHAVKCQVDVRVHMAEPDAHQLLRVAKDEGADLIVI